MSPHEIRDLDWYVERYANRRRLSRGDRRRLKRRLLAHFHLAPLCLTRLWLVVTAPWDALVERWYGLGYLPKGMRNG